MRFLAPEATGSGIPHVMAAIERAATQKQPSPVMLHSVRLIAVKIASSVAAIFGGGAVGREGPTIQISAAIFELFDGVFKKYVSTRRSREALLIAGGGAGLAAAFNTPLGGVVFAIEELASQHFNTFKGVLILAVVSAGYVSQAVSSPYLFLGHPAIGDVSWLDTVIGLAVATGIGTIGALFGVLLYACITKARSLSVRRHFLLVCVCALLVSGACVWLGPDASGGGALLIRKLLLGGPGEHADVSDALAVWRVLGVVITYVSAVAGGIFAPSLAAGAAFGDIAASVLAFKNHNLLIVLGMIAFLTGVTRSPFTCFILVFEMTDRQAAVMPMMAAALLANIAARVVAKESFYEQSRARILGHTEDAAPRLATDQRASTDLNR